MLNCLAIRRYSDDLVTYIFDCQGKSNRYRENAEKGVNINLNHNEYYTQEMNLEEAQKLLLR